MREFGAGQRFLLAFFTLLLFSVAQTGSANASAYYASFAGNGVFGMGVYPLTPFTFGTAIGSPTAVAPHDLTVAGSYLYWLDGSSIYRADLDGSNRITFQTFGADPLSLAVDAVNAHYYASFAGNGIFGMGEYPLTPFTFGTAIGSPTAVAPHDLTVAGSYLYWLDGSSIYRSDLDGSNRTTFQTFGADPLSLAVDAANADYYASFVGNGVFGMGVYPLTPFTFGAAIGSPTAVAPHDLTVAGGYLYWLDGSSIYRADLDGSNRTTFQTFGADPLSLAVYDPPPAPSVPESSTQWLVLAGMMVALWLGRRRTQATA